ncbi:competence protein CoiA family protein [Streptomyces sp. YIM B13502]|uniref:competence protein CoiA family protein n=1 Tax=Streptomyces sp. YIM B13502 TaxID=3366317 RepID=UPI00369CCC10
MPIEEEDTRKVQTAVAGSPGADRPVYLPMDAASYDHFIREYPTREFYCGTLLGGCGKKLSARKYRDKKCHFAHVVSGQCRRVSTNEASADHLYIGRALAAWMKKQKYKNVQVRYKQGGQSLRELVDISYTREGSPRRRLMRVQLARRSKTEWEQSDAELHGQWGGVQWLFGPDSMLANWQVDRQGYAIRIQCRPAGITRVVEVGVQFADSPVEWVSLSRCRMTAHGIQAPALELSPTGLSCLDREPRPSASRLAEAPPSVSHRAQDTGLSPSGESNLAPVIAPAADPLVRKLRTFEKPKPVESHHTKREAPSGLVRVPHSINGTPEPSLEQFRAEDDRRATERVLSLLDRLDQIGDDLHFDQLQKVLREIAFCEEAMWRPLSISLRQRTAAWRAHVEAMAERPTFRQICASADLVRWVLDMAARRAARPCTWMELGERLDRRLASLHPEDKVSVLVEVDRGTCSGRPLLSALVAARNNRVHPLYAQVLDHLDRPVPAPDAAQTSWEADVREHRASEVLRVSSTGSRCRADSCYTTDHAIATTCGSLRYDRTVGPVRRFLEHGD